MHFFHPIQQCAQQVYHSALPLSPTSSHLRECCLQSTIDDQLPHITAFLGAPEAWGLLLRTIDVRPRQLTCITASFQRIIVACKEIVNIYDAVTFVLRQSLYAPEAVIKIQDSLHRSILFFAHSFSVTMWDVQTGGLIHTFTTQSTITDIAISLTGDNIACGSSDGSITSWNVHTKECKGFGNGEPVVTICWFSPTELVALTQSSVYIGNTTTVCTLGTLSVSGHPWGMIYLGGGEFLVGSFLSGGRTDRELCSLEVISYQYPSTPQEKQSLVRQRTFRTMRVGRLVCPTRVGNTIVCVAPPSGVHSFDASSLNQTNNPPLLDATTSVAVSLNRNLVAQTKDSIQIFSLDVLTSSGSRDEARPSHIYPLGEKYIICLIQPDKTLTMLKLETLQEFHPVDLQLRSLFVDQLPSVRASSSRGLFAEFGASAVMQACQLGTPLPEWTEAAEEDALLCGWSPESARIATFYTSPRRELHVKDAKDRTTLANLSLEGDDLGAGEVYDLIFESETRFYLMIDGSGLHVQIPHDIVASPSGGYSHTITKGEPVPLPEPRAIPPYSLDANCEWVIDAQSRKICWISPGNVRRGNGGHFWAGLSLVMVGDDGVVRKVTLEEPDC